MKHSPFPKIHSRAASKSPKIDKPNSSYISSIKSSISSLFHFNSTIIEDCFLDSKEIKIYKPEFNPCINYVSLTETMEKDVKKNLDALKELSLYANYYNN